MIPSEIFVDQVSWCIEMCDTLPETEWGETRPLDCRVLLDSNPCISMQEMTFWHELIHVLFKTRDFRLCEGLSQDDLEEQVASFLGPALYSFFRANTNIEWLNG